MKRFSLRSLLSSPRIRALVSLTVQTLSTPLTRALLAIGSVILGLVWVFLDFFNAMAGRDLSAWLPLIVLLILIALLTTANWQTTALAILLVIAALAVLYALLFLIGSLGWLPKPLITVSGIIVLIAFNSAVFLVAHRVQRDQHSDDQNPDKGQQRRRFLILIPKTTLGLTLGGLCVKTYFWDDPSRRWLLSDLFPYQEAGQKLTLAPPLAIPLQDASRLTTSSVAEIRSPQSVFEVIQAISDARSTSRKISLSGIRHSMGGQALGSNTLHLDMTHLDQVVYNDADQTVTVGPGATWKQIQTALSPHGRAIRVMQDSNIFSVGGSMSVNVHGKDPRFGSLIESVTSLTLVTADGRTIQCDRTHHADLFTSAIGGLGIIGIITEATLMTTDNSRYRFSLTAAPIQALRDRLEALGNNPANQLFEAHLSVDSDRFLTESLIYLYTEDPSLPHLADDLQGENSIWLRKVIFQASRTSNTGKSLRWDLEKLLTPLVEPKMVSRNTAMAVPVRFLQNPDPQTTDLLQEYFIPTEQFYAFLETYKQLLRKHHIDLLNVTIRKVVQDTTALVSYARTDMYGFVVYYKVPRTQMGIQTIQAFTSELVDYLISIEARYYLCYGSYYSPSQLTAMYPAIPTLFALKTHYDPGMILTNEWYETYRAARSLRSSANLKATAQPL
jgi:decaprenylphospho-beta-D-ribofuranose 2-oxidase